MHVARIQATARAFAAIRADGQADGGRGLGRSPTGRWRSAGGEVVLPGFPLGPKATHESLFCDIDREFPFRGIIISGLLQI